MVRTFCAHCLAKYTHQSKKSHKNHPLKNKQKTGTPFANYRLSSSPSPGGQANGAVINGDHRFDITSIYIHCNAVGNAGQRRPECRQTIVCIQDAFFVFTFPVNSLSRE